MFKEKLIIVRHGRSLYNVRQTKDLDSALTDHGKRQAAAAGRLVAKHIGFHFGMCFTSPFLRCLQTSEIIDKHLPSHALVRRSRFHVMPGLREYVNHSGTHALVPSRATEFKDFSWPTDIEEWNFEREHNEEFMNRMTKVYMDLPSVSLVVTHGLPAMLLARIATNPAGNEIPIWDNSLDNGSVTLIVNGRPVWYGRNGHVELDEEMSEE